MTRKRRLLTRLVPLAIALLGVVLWQFGPLEAVQAVTSLSDPARLRTLSKRGANDRLNKIVYWLDRAQARGLGPEQTVWLAQMLNGTPGPQAELVKSSLLRNLKIASELGLLTNPNRELLKRGQAATVTQGPYSGELVEIDHIVPFSLAPEIGNELANLEMMPERLNRRKSNRVGQRQLNHAEKLFEAGLLMKESMAKVKASAR